MALHPASESSDFSWKSLRKDILSSERLNEGARPVFSEQLVSLASDGIQHFVPEYIREKFHERIEPNVCTIKVVCKTEVMKPFYTFVLSWYNDQPYRDRDNGTLTSKSKKLPINVTSRTKLKEERPMQSRETTVEIGEQTRRCDGPCGKMRSVKELQVHGRCEHAICPLCTDNAPMIENIDGSVGCCNPECFAADLAALCPDPVLRHKYFQMIINKNKIDEIMAICHGRKDRKMKQQLQSATASLSSSRTSSASKSNSDKRGLKELICIRALILEKGPMKTICRRHSISEIASTEFLRNALQWVVGDRQNLHKSRIFFNYGRNIEDSKLEEIDLKQYGDKEISYFPSTNGMLNFVIDYTNLIRGSSPSPYI